MKRYILTIIAALLVAAGAMAQNKPDKAKRDQWNREMQQAKLEFMAKELKISDAQKDKFNQTYNAMQAELNKLRTETHAMTKAVEKKADATDLEYEKAAEAMFEFKQKEGAIEMKYYPEFRKILSKEQLFHLKKAENKWTKELMKHRKRK